MRAFRCSLLVALTCSFSCSILIDTNTAQCASDGDCEARFPSRGLVCLGASCLPKTPEAEAGAPPTCTNAQCMDEEAKATGGSAICVAGKCQPLKLVRKIDGTLICLDEVLPLDANTALRNDDVLVIGGFVPLQVAAPLADRHALAYRLALDELRNFGGLDIGKAGAKRPVVMAICASDVNLVEDGLAHLTQDLKVPAIVARFDDEKAPYLVNQYAVKNDVFTMNPNPAPYALVEQESVGGLAWHLLGGTEDVALSYAPLVTMLENVVRTKKGLSPTDDVKVALLATNFALDETIAETIQRGPQTRGDSGIVRDVSKAIHFNAGKSAEENLAAGAFLRVPLMTLQQNPPPSESAYAASAAAAREQLRIYRPDIVIAVTSTELKDIVEPLEKALFADAGPTAFPHWALSVQNAAIPGVLAHVKDLQSQGATETYQRFVGIQYAGSTRKDVRDAWLGRMDTLYAPQGVDQATYAATENSYDAIYWLAYGLFKGTPPGQPANGTAVANGVRKLLIGGTEVFPGGTREITDALRALREQPNVRFVGALGPRDIDPRTGATVFGSGSVYCYQRPQAGTLVTIKYDALRYDAAKGTLALPTPTSEGCYIGLPPAQ